MSMSWPSATRFSESLQNPAFSFHPQLQYRGVPLRQATIESDAKKQPTPRSGQFANVYKALVPNPQGTQPLAVRVFTSENAERKERYQSIGSFLESNNLTQCRDTPLVEFNYQEQAIRVLDNSGKLGWYPVITMEWVKGQTLFNWTEQQCQTGNVNTLRKAMEDWVALADFLKQKRLAHGDLQHGNVMVTSQNELKLVDYDCMCVPDLVGRRNLELGVVPYQHPARGPETDLFLGLDHFSTLFIFVALRALAEHPGLWQDHIAQCNYDKLLFKKEDFNDPVNSPLIQSLTSQKEEKTLRKMTQALLDLWQQETDLAKIPSLAQLLNDFDTVQSLLAVCDWDGAVNALDQDPGIQVPPDREPEIAKARERVQARIDLQQAVDYGTEPEIQQAYVPALFQNYPAASSLVDYAKKSPQVVPILDELQRAVQQQEWHQLQQIWDRQTALLNQRNSAKQYFADVQLWRPRNAACDKFLTLLDQNPRDANRLDQALQELERVGRHPRADSRIDEARTFISQEQALKTIQSVLQNTRQTSTHQADLQLVEAYQLHGSLLTSNPRAQSLLTSVQQAQTRLDQYQLLDNCIQSQGSPLTESGEQAIQQTAKGLPAGYEHPHRDRVNQATARLQALSEVRTRLAQPTPSEASLAESWTRLLTAQGRDLCSATEQNRLDEAQQRLPLLQGLKQIPLSLPLNELDEKLLAIWKPGLLDACPDAAPWKQCHDLALQRTEALRLLWEAFHAKDEARLFTLLQDSASLLQGYELPPELRDFSDETYDQIMGCQAMLRSLPRTENGLPVEGQPAQFVASYDYRLIQHFPALFEPAQASLVGYVRQHLRVPQSIGLTLPRGHALIPDPKRSSGGKVCYLARWNWPAVRLTDQCLLWVCSGTPQEGKDYPDLETLLAELRPIQRHTCLRQNYGSSGVPLFIEERLLPLSVVVIAVLHLPGSPATQVFSNPTYLGRVQKTVPPGKNNPPRRKF